MNDADLMTMEQLSERSGFTVRTLRYYVQRGMLPPPGAGPGPKYGPEYLRRAQLIRELQKRHLPLDEIAEQLSRMSDAQIAEQLQATGVAESAMDYLNSILPASELQSSTDDIRSLAEFRMPEASKPPAAQASAQAADRSQWTRYQLSPDIELHVRRPASREFNRRVERIMAAAEQILNE